MSDSYETVVYCRAKVCQQAKELRRFLRSLDACLPADTYDLKYGQPERARALPMLVDGFRRELDRLSDRLSANLVLLADALPTMLADGIKQQQASKEKEVAS